MEERTDDPVAVKVEGHSQCVILTYFQGDIGSMVDAHFTRALSKGCRAKAPAMKTKKIRKPIKLGKHTLSTREWLHWLQTGNHFHLSLLCFFCFSPAEETSTCQGNAASYSDSQVPPLGGGHLIYGPADDPTGQWHSFITRSREGSGLPSSTYSLSQDGLSLTGQQYATSLLNLLHSDRNEMGPSMASSSKPELLPSWTVPQGFRDSVDPAVGFEPGKPSSLIQLQPWWLLWAWAL